MSPVKIAVFVSGPIRFVDLVRQNLDIRLQGVAHDYFYHLWMQDLSNKVRQGGQTDPALLTAHVSTKALVLHQPYPAEFFEKSIGTYVNTHSVVNAVVGMFLGINQLCQLFKALPDRSEYTHILRVRTDCAFTGDGFVEALALHEATVIISGDPGLPAEGWVSDHVLCAPADLFLGLYGFERIEEFYTAFHRGQRNPEKILKHLLDTRLPPGTRVEPRIQRYGHYQLIYSPPRPTDQAWLRAMIEAGRIPEVFLEPEKHRDITEDRVIMDVQRTQWAPKRDPFRNPFLNFLRRLKRKVTGK